MTYLASRWTPLQPYSDTFIVDGSDSWHIDANKAYQFLSPDDNLHRYEVHSGDVFSKPGYSDPVTAERVESYNATYWQDGAPIQFSYDFMMDPGARNTAQWMVLGQLHADTNQSPPIAVAFDGNDRMKITGNYTNSSGALVYRTLWQDTADIVRGQWYNMKFDISFDGPNTGHVYVWRNGVEIVHYDGVLGYAAQTKTYWREGIYREAAAETLVVSYKNFDIAPFNTTTGGDINGTAGNDVLTGTLGNDVINGLVGNDLINGNSGNDTLNGGAGDDLLFGNAGDDTLIGEGHALLSFNQLWGGAGIDTADYSAERGRIFVDLRASAGHIDNGAGYILNDLMNSIENVLGGSNNDVLAGTDADANLLNGGSGTDLLFGFDGADTLIGGSANAGQYNQLFGGGGSDSASYEGITSGVYADLNIFAGYVRATGGSLILTDVYSSIENLTGGSSADSLVGDGGANRIFGGGGADQLYGNTGAGFDASADTFVYTAPRDSYFTGSDTIVNFQTSVDKLDFSAFGIDSSNVTISSGGGSTSVYANTDGIAGADLAIVVIGANAVTLGDILFV